MFTKRLARSVTCCVVAILFAATFYFVALVDSSQPDFGTLSDETMMRSLGGVSGKKVVGYSDKVAHCLLSFSRQPDYYLKSPRKNPKGPNSGEHRVLRGGSWDSIRLQLRTAFRYSDKEDRRSYNIGFRCVQDASHR